MRYSHSVIISPALLRDHPYPAPARIARGTREIKPTPFTKPPERIGNDWYWSLQMEQLGRNLAMVGALETAHRLGAAELEISSLQTTKLAGADLIAALQRASKVP